MYLAGLTEMALLCTKVEYYYVQPMYIQLVTLPWRKSSMGDQGEGTATNILALLG